MRAILRWGADLTHVGKVFMNAKFGEFSKEAYCTISVVLPC